MLCFLASLPFPSHSLGSKLESFSPSKCLDLDTSANVPWYFKKEHDAVSQQRIGFCLNLGPKCFYQNAPSEEVS